MTDHITIAKNILFNNRLYHYTVPSRNLYKHQWSWDSGWIIYGLNIINKTDLSEKEIEHLFFHQWNNGLIPSIVFNLLDIDYYPGPNVWRVNEFAEKLTLKSNTTGIIQPPIHASACLDIYKSNKNIKFLENIFPKLMLWHKYLYNERDPYNEGLVYIRHPWESGMDNSPLWDNSLNRIKITEFIYSKDRVDNKKVNVSERPTDLTYERYISLIEIFKKCNYDEKKIFENTEFAIQDVLFNTLLLKSNYALHEISNILKKDLDTNLINQWINKTKNSINKKLYNNNFYYDYDIIKNKYIEIKTITGLSPIIFVNCEKKKQLINILKDNFLDIKNHNYSISSIDRYDSNFDEINYWRGPTWVNLTWLLLSGIKDSDIELYHKIKNNIIQKIESIGFFEYFNSNDLKNLSTSGIGDNFFSWTAALYICLISDKEF